MVGNAAWSGSRGQATSRDDARRCFLRRGPLVDKNALLILLFSPYFFFAYLLKGREKWGRGPVSVSSI